MHVTMTTAATAASGSGQFSSSTSERLKSGVRSDSATVVSAPSIVNSPCAKFTIPVTL